MKGNVILEKLWNKEIGCDQAYEPSPRASSDAAQLNGEVMSVCFTFQIT
jgi:hypothetical protein